MKIAVLGAGFSGLAICWNLLKQHNNVTVFDPKGIGGGASGIAAGLLHPYGGLHAKYSWRGLEGMQATVELLSIASEFLQKPVASYTGTLRPALIPEQKVDFLNCCNRYPEVKWLSAAECSQYMPQPVSWEGIYIKNGITVFTDLYLQGLWQACLSKGAKLEKMGCKSLKELTDFDKIIVAMGANTKMLPELAHLPLSIVKGQVLEMEWPKQYSPLKTALNSQGYVVMNADMTSCFAGTTFERDYRDFEPDLVVAKNEILPKLRGIWPMFEELPIIGCRAGLRAVTPNRIPYHKQVLDNCWVFAGMGSKGLLYHALLAREMASSLNS